MTSPPLMNQVYVSNCSDFYQYLHFHPILGTTEDALSNTTVSVSARIRVGKKKLKCDFFLVFVLDTVDVESSSMSCNKGAGGQTAKVINFNKIVAHLI